MKVYVVKNLKLVLNGVEITDWYTDMEKYIRDYKHLIGCGSVHDLYDVLEDAQIWYFTECELKSYFSIKYRPIKLITHDDRLVSYEEYMSLYYPEYIHVWWKQLC